MRVVNLWKGICRKIRVQDGKTGTRLSERSRELIPERLHCSFVLVPLDIVSPMILFFQAFISCTGGQSVSHMLLWQPSECVHLMVMIVLLLFLENKYDDDDE